MSKLVDLKPKISEKTYALSELTNTYAFEVPKTANKLSIAEAIASQYGVKVSRVRISSIPGKPKRSIRKGGRSVRQTSRQDIRKAYVTLVEGDKLPIFSAVEEANPAPEAK